jgi:hypothetical protein
MSRFISLEIAENANEIPVTLADDHASVAAFEALMRDTGATLHRRDDAPAGALELPDSDADAALDRLRALPLVAKGVILVAADAPAMQGANGQVFDPAKTKVHWPADFGPVGVPTYAYNEILSDALPETIFAWLARAPLWPTWYPNSADVKLLSFAGDDLQLGTHFSWTTFGVHVDTFVEEFVPPYRIAWRGYLMGSEVVHAWVFERDGARTRMITEEVQRGLVCLLAKEFFIKGLHANHQIWLENLAAQAETGFPG